MPSLKGQPLADAINRLMKKVKKYDVLVHYLKPKEDLFWLWC